MRRRKYIKNKCHKCPKLVFPKFTIKFEDKFYTRLEFKI
jgi:hypothetical protein